jgi:hypothetical protein
MWYFTVNQVEFVRDPPSHCAHCGGKSYSHSLKDAAAGSPWLGSQRESLRTVI